MWTWGKHVLAWILLVDGVLTVVWGAAFLRWQRRVAPAVYRPVLDALLRWPEPMLRGAAAAEAMIGLWLLRRVRSAREREA